MAVHVYNPSTQKVYVGGSQVQGQSGLHSKDSVLKIQNQE